MNNSTVSNLINVGKNSSYMLLVTIIINVVNLISKVFLTRFLGADLFGDFVKLTSRMSLAVIVLSIGLSSGMIKYVPQLLSKRDFFSLKKVVISSWLWVGTIGVLGSVVFYFLKDNFFHDLSILPVDSNMFCVTLFVVPFLIFLDINKGLFSGFQKPYLGPTFSMLLPKLGFLFVFFSALLLRIGNESSLLLSFAMSTVISVVPVFVFYIAKIHMHANEVVDSTFSLKRFFKYSLQMFSVGFAYYLFQQFNTVFLGFYADSAQTGSFAIAVALITLTLFITRAIASIFAPKISKLIYTGEIETVKDMYKFLTKWNMLISTPIFIAICFFPKEILGIFGKEFQYANTVLLILCVGQAVNVLTGFCGTLLSMGEKHKYEMVNGFLVAILCIILNIILVPRFGAVGAAISYSTSITVVNILKTFEVLLLFNFHPFNTSLGKSLLLVAFLILVLSVVRHLFDSVFAFILIFVVVYSLLLVVTIRISDSDKEKQILVSLAAKLGLPHTSFKKKVHND